MSEYSNHYLDQIDREERDDVEAALRMELTEAATRIRELEAEVAKLSDGAQGRWVKPLEWVCTDWSAADGVEGENDCEWTAGIWPLTAYVISWWGGDRFEVHTPLADMLGASTLEAAKAAAQADYERRILSALTPAPVTVGEAARIVWDDCLQKASPEAAKQREKAIKAIMRMKIPSIPMAQRWAIVNVALRALSGEGE